MANLPSCDRDCATVPNTITMASKDFMVNTVSEQVFKPSTIAKTENNSIFVQLPRNSLGSALKGNSCQHSLDLGALSCHGTFPVKPTYDAAEQEHYSLQ